MSIKEVTRYETSDGTLFVDKIYATSHQHAVDLVAVAKQLMPDNNIGCDEYIQLNHTQYNNFKRAFDDIVKICHFNMEDRNSPIHKLTWLLGCVDTRLRMYNQPYYANHPTETADFSRVDSA